LRLLSYGVPAARISLTGFPLPPELLGAGNLDVCRDDYVARLRRLDPKGRFLKHYRSSVEHLLGATVDPGASPAPLTVTFAVGGAGAQGDIGRQIACSLKELLRRGAVRLNLVAGVREEVRSRFERIKEQVLPGNPNLRIVSGSNKPEYFRAFSRILHSTDVLWTKPSELSFYCGLGIPIVIAPTIGSQEVFNRKWLLEIGAGKDQEDPSCTGEWLFDLLDSGKLAEISWSGFLNARKCGTYKVREILAHGIEAGESTRTGLEVA
jgi:hypothetical protein